MSSERRRPADDPVALSVLTVSWNSAPSTARGVEAALACLDRLAARPIGRRIEGELVLVDNASSDGTGELLRQAHGDHPRLRLVTNTANVGFAAANNQAFALARGDLVLVANPDVVLEEDVVADLVDHLVTHPGTGMVTCRLVGADGVVQATTRRLPTLPIVALAMTRTGRRLDARLAGGRVGRRYRGRDLPEHGVVPVEQAAGALVLLERGTVEAVGGLFDERFPLLFNDVDLSRRVRRAGLRIDLLADRRLVHEGGVSLRQVDEDRRRRSTWDGLHTYFHLHRAPWEGAVLAALEPTAVRRLPPPPLDAPAPAERPLVSVVIPCHQYAHLLAGAVRSALAQTWNPLEVLVVDDGSTDGSHEVAAQFAAEGVRCIRRPNGGLSAARNTGMAHARGEWVTFLDADDELDPAYVATCLGALAHDPGAAFAYTASRTFGEAGHRISPPTWDPERLKDGNYVPATALVRADLVRRHPFDEGNRIGWEDWDLWLTLAERGYRGVLVDRELLRYRRHDGSMTSALHGARKARLKAIVLRRHRRFVGRRRWLAAERRALRMTLGEGRRSLGRRLGPPRWLTSRGRAPHARRPSAGRRSSGRARSSSPGR